MFREEAERVIAVMPSSQGVLPWPLEGPNAVTLADEGELPLQDYSIDRVLLVHGLEYSEQVRPLLTEIWRVLAGGGRLLVVVPNRRGIWARIDGTPFGQGHPYTPSQLSRLLREVDFTPERVASALFVPPNGSRVMLRSANAVERIGERWFTTFAGVSMVEATKQLYAKPAVRRMERRRQVYLPVPHGRAAPPRRLNGFRGCAMRRYRRRNRKSPCSASRLASAPRGVSGDTACRRRQAATLRSMTIPISSHNATKSRMVQR